MEYVTVPHPEEKTVESYEKALEKATINLETQSNR